MGFFFVLEWLDIVLNSSVFGLILAGLGWVVRKIYEEWKSKRKVRKKESYLEGLRAVAKVYNSMDLLKETDEITRVLLLEVSNGGHVPRPGSRMYVNAINVKHDDADVGRDILQRYEHVQIDDDYIKMCISVQETNRPYVINLNNALKVDANLLESYYLSEGILYSEVYHIYTDGSDEKMFIMSISTINKGEDFQREGIRATINAEVNMIRSQFEKYREST